MGILIAFAAGYVFGARAGSQDFDDVVQALQAIRRVRGVPRPPAQPALARRAQPARAGAMLDQANEGEGRALSSVTTQDLVERVKALVGRE